MANSKFEYVKTFEQASTLLPNTYLVIRVDGRGFHRLCAKYGFEKPNDRRALDLMNAAATGVMTDIPDILLAYGVSDEFSFVIGRACKLFERRESKILTTIVSTFTSYYIYLWQSHFPEKHLSSPIPSFDGRVVQYPAVENLRDYLSWRQVDCHINNLYNTTFWALQQQGGMNATQAEEKLKGTLASDKHEILFSKFNINYNNEPAIFRKGSLLYHDYKSIYPDAVKQESASSHSDNEMDKSRMRKEKTRKKPRATSIILEHTDIIKNDFWAEIGWLLSIDWT